MQSVPDADYPCHATKAERTRTGRVTALMRLAELTVDGRRHPIRGRQHRLRTAVLATAATGLIVGAAAGCTSTGGSGGSAAMSSTVAPSQPPTSGNTISSGKASAGALTITGSRVVPEAPGASITAKSSTAGPSSGTASIQLVIHNAAAAADTLTAATSELGGSITLVTADGTPTRAVTIPAGQSVTIGDPKGPRLLLRGATLRPAGTLPIRLAFTRSGQIELFAPIPGPAS